MGTRTTALVATVRGSHQSWQDVTGLIAKGLGLVSVGLALWANYRNDSDTLFWMKWAYGIAAVAIASLFLELYRINFKLAELERPSIRPKLTDSQLLELTAALQMGEVLHGHFSRKYPKTSDILQEGDLEEFGQWVMRTSTLVERILGKGNSELFLRTTGISVSAEGGTASSDRRVGLEIMTKRLYQLIQENKA